MEAWGRASAATSSGPGRSAGYVRARNQAPASAQGPSASITERGSTRPPTSPSQGSLVLGTGVAGFLVAGPRAAGIALVVLIVVHYALSIPRIDWLLAA